MWTKKQIRKRKEGRQTLNREGIKESDEKIKIIMKKEKNGRKKVGRKKRSKEGKDNINNNNKKKQIKGEKNNEINDRGGWGRGTDREKKEKIFGWGFCFDMINHLKFYTR